MTRDIAEPSHGVAPNQTLLARAFATKMAHLNGGTRQNAQHCAQASMLAPRFPLVLASALALGVVALTPRTARACSCVDSAITSPSEVPRNGKLFINADLLERYVNEYSNAPEGSELTEERAAQLRLVRFLDTGEEAETVGFSVTKLSMSKGSDIFVLHPEQLLTPGEWQLGTENGSYYFLTFQVTDEVDEEPPPAPVLESLRTIEEYLGPNESTSCGDGPFLGVAAQFSPGDGFLLLDDTNESEHAETALDGPITLATTTSALYLGQLACGISYEPGTHLHLRVRRVDASGNFSDWSEPVNADIPEEERGGACSLAGAPARTTWPALVAFGLFGMLWQRRRRRALA